MIKTLKRKFLIITFITILLALGSIIAYINIINYTNISERHSKIIYQTLHNNEIYQNPGIDNYSKVTVLKITESYEIIQNGELINSQLDIKSILEAILNQDKNSGVYEDYRYIIIVKDGDSIIGISSMGQDRYNFSTNAINSLIVYAVSLLVIFLVLILSSNFILKPFIINEEKHKQFITDASHEFKTPITVIKSNIDVLLLKEKDNEWIQSIKFQTNRLESLTKNLIELTLLNETKKLVLTSFSLTDCVNEVIVEYQNVINQKNIEYINQIQNGISLNGCETKVKDMLKIIFDNSVKYATKSIGVSLNSKELIVYNNTNLKDGNYNHLLERFVREDDSRSTIGYGIGLSIVRKICDLNNLDINITVQNNIFSIKIKL